VDIPIVAKIKELTSTDENAPNTKGLRATEAGAGGIDEQSATDKCMIQRKEFKILTGKSIAMEG
jgi:hypothetical protein